MKLREEKKDLFLLARRVRLVCARRKKIKEIICEHEMNQEGVLIDLV